MLKTMPEYFRAVASNAKRFEIRKNDRDYKVGDGLLLREYKDNEFTGNEINAVITYMTDYELKKGCVVMGIEVSEREKHVSIRERSLPFMERPSD